MTSTQRSYAGSFDLTSAGQTVSAARRISRLLAQVTLRVHGSVTAADLPTATCRLLERVADLVVLRNPDSAGHGQRVRELCRGILRELPGAGPDRRQAALILTAARIHDLGKVGVPDVILNKPGTLTAEEWAIMRAHPAWGAALVAPYPQFAEAAAIIRNHHERWDGIGYPRGLPGPAIPLGARVIAVADSFDAMTSRRPYCPTLSAAEAVAILQAGRGTQWDPQIVDAFLRSMATRD